MTKTKAMAHMLTEKEPYFLLPDGKRYSPLPFYNFLSPQIAARCHPEKTFGSRPDMESQTAPAHRSDSAAKINRRVRSCFLRISYFCVSSSFSQLTRTFPYRTRIVIRIPAFFYLLSSILSELISHCLQDYRKHVLNCYSPRYRLILFVADATASSSPAEPFR